MNDKRFPNNTEIDEAFMKLTTGSQYRLPEPLWDDAFRLDEYRFRKWLILQIAALHEADRRNHDLGITAFNAR